ncbi:phosphoglycolate phosphatase [Defluviimonas sp. 20V17]|uniref:Phosphoglycolate phosphatase n=1 Tax=Allgaiera indica TaxID=765699 RepID=A0AAN5A0C3_9RHOB|nr:phosphoglycolate phosphatase [Allgaiera indica]KDB05416.1 phosphoglycolate phosphatase [Defluviimonas sp. 20V17]GHE04154.1 phosphoglycolate phosphatase [Allgaiera indica]SDX50009.1 phosphoglycolate phosphatase [Allgaiera indica]
MSDVPALLFDLDGTLIDSIPAIHAMVNAVMADLGYPALGMVQVRGFVGRGVPHLIRQVLEAQGEDPEGPMFARVETALMARYLYDVEGNTPYPGVSQALSALAARGCRLGVCTNKPHGPAIAALTHVGLLDHFEVVLGGDSLPSRKPDPAMVHHAHDRLGGGPLLYVGDSEVDAETAANAGAAFALYTEGYRHAPIEALPHRFAFSDWRGFADLALPHLLAGETG